MNRTILAAATLAAALALPLAPALAATAIQSTETAAGTVLADGDGMSLYTFDKDAPAVSNCYDDCAAKWPPLTAKTSSEPTGDFGIIARKDGARQWAFRGQPLYLWVNDAAPGDTTGDGVKGVWHLARP